jgi:hypothetical protein
MSARVISSAVAVNAPMGSRLDPLPATPYSPDLNPIEMAFAKLKAHLRARAINTINALWKAIGRHLHPVIIGQMHELLHCRCEQTLGDNSSAGTLLCMQATNSPAVG